MTLQLIVKQPWFDMEASGVKSEEYREITAYWVKRLLTSPHGAKYIARHAEGIAEGIKSVGLRAAMVGYALEPIAYDRVAVSNGYRTDRLTWRGQFKGLTVGRGRAEWGAPESETFIIKL